MKINELTPGLYKVKKKDYYASGVKPSRTRFKTEIHLLRVTRSGGKLLYFLDHSTYGQHPSEMNFSEDYEVISKFSGDPQVLKGSITLSFQDANGDEYNFTVLTAWGLRDIFESMPWLKKPFDFLPRKQRIVKVQKGHF